MRPEPTPTRSGSAASGASGDPRDPSPEIAGAPESAGLVLTNPVDEYRDGLTVEELLERCA